MFFEDAASREDQPDSSSLLDLKLVEKTSHINLALDDAAGWEPGHIHLHRPFHLVVSLTLLKSAQSSKTSRIRGY